MNRFISTSVACALLFASSIARADELFLTPTRDTSIFNNVENSNGASYDLYTGRNNQGTYRRSLLYFDVAGQLPAGAIISDVSLTMRMSGGSPSLPSLQDVALYRLSGTWGEGASGAGQGNGGTSTAGAGGASNGFAPDLGDATWNMQLWNSDAWTTPGGDFSPTVSATQSISIDEQYVTWSSPGLTADVLAWLDDPSTNFGWIMIGNEALNGTSRRFVSSEAPNAAFHPMLRIEYMIAPEPATILSFAIAGLACAWLYRRRRAS